MTRAAGPGVKTILAQASSGDEVAFARIVSEHHEDMRRVCAIVCGDDDLAEEAVQAAWPRAWKKLDTVRDPERLRPWLISIAVNEARQILRKRLRRRAKVDVVYLDEERAGGVDPAHGIDLIDLRAALSKLDPDDRALLAMRYVAGFSATELSIALGISPSGTRSRFERLLTRLRTELDDV